MEAQIQILRRAIDAIEYLITQGLTAGVATVCGEAGLHGAKYREIRSHLNAGVTPRYHKVDPLLLSHLVKSYNISGDWLLTGLGSMRR
jgi:hypothetical protein